MRKVFFLFLTFLPALSYAARTSSVGGGGGSGDLTDVFQGQGVVVTNGSGPSPTVALNQNATNFIWLKVATIPDTSGGGGQLEFYPAQFGNVPVLILTQQAGAADAGQVLFRTLTSTTAYWASFGTNFSIGVSTSAGVAVPGSINRIQISNQNPTITFNANNSGISLIESSMTFDSGSDDVVAGWGTDGIYRVSNGTFAVKEMVKLDFLSSQNTIGVDANGYIVAGVNSGGTTLITTTGPVTGTTGPNISTQTIVLLFDSATSLGQLLYGGTYYWRPNPSSVTLQGQGVLLSTEAYVPYGIFNSSGATTNIQKTSTTIAYLQMITSTLTQNNGTGQLVRTNSSGQLTNLDGSLLVRISSLAISNVTQGNYTLANVTVNPQGQIIAIASGTAGAGDVVAANNNVFTGTNTFRGSVTATSSFTVTQGTANFSGAVGMLIPSGTAPTIAVTGAFAVDTTSGQAVYFDGNAAVVLPSTFSKSMTIETPAVGDYPFFWRPHTATTVTSMVCLSSSATSATLQVDECDANGINCVAINTAIACTTSATQMAVTNSALDAGDIIRTKVTAISGTTGWVMVTMYATETRQ